MDAGVAAPHDRSRYEGNNLVRLLLALLAPGFFLFLKLGLSVAETGSGITSEEIAWINEASYAILAIFFALQFLCARYVQRLLRPASSHLRDAFQYIGVLLLCLFISYCGAVICEAFGYEILIRSGAISRMPG